MSAPYVDHGDVGELWENDGTMCNDALRFTLALIEFMRLHVQHPWLPFLFTLSIYRSQRKYPDTGDNFHIALDGKNIDVPAPSPSSFFSYPINPVMTTPNPTIALP